MDVLTNFHASFQTTEKLETEKEVVWIINELKDTPVGLSRQLEQVGKIKQVERQLETVNNGEMKEIKNIT